MCPSVCILLLEKLIEGDNNMGKIAEAKRILNHYIRKLGKPADYIGIAIMKLKWKA